MPGRGRPGRASRRLRRGARVAGLPRRHGRDPLHVLADSFVALEPGASRAEHVAPAALAFVTTHKPRDAVEAADLGRSYEEVEIRTSDGLRLAGWYAPSDNGAAVLVFTGRSGTVEEARMLAGHGYGVLLVDMRGQGESQGGEDLNPEYFEAAGDPKELWEIPEAGHTGGLEARPQEYEERIVGFFDEALLARG